MFVTPLGATLALRIGARYVVTAGLLLMAAAMVWVATIGALAAYFGPVIGAMTLMAIGFSLITAPSTAALMETLSPEQIGAGAAVNETTRELGGTLGVALVGSVFSSLFGPQVLSTLSKLRLSHHQLIVARGSLAAAQATVAHFPSTIRALADKGLTNAFIEGFHRGCLVAAVVTAAVALTVFRFLPNGGSRKTQRLDLNAVNNSPEI
jgi:hypothetical protein